MSDSGVPFQSGAYPEKQRRRNSPVERALLRLAYLPQFLFSRLSAAAIAARVSAAAAQSEDFQADLQALRYELRRSRLNDDLAARALALVATRAHGALGTKPADAQVAAAWMLLRGRCVELPAMEARPLAAALAAVVSALSGVPAQVIVPVGLVARRDCEAMRPLIESLGLSVACVDESASLEQRRSAYAADITYCVNREIALDYLRDRLVLKGRPRALRLRMEALTAQTPRTGELLLRGLQFAIVDGADTVLVDSVQTPVSISVDAENSQEARWLAEALKLARQLAEGEDYSVHDGKYIRISGTGKSRLAELASEMAGIWQGAARREEIVKLALIAERVLQKDTHYTVAEQALQIGEDTLRMHAPEPAMVRLLRLLTELKEKCRLTATRETLARIAYQRFFRGYLKLSAMTSDARGLGAELWGVYRLRLARLPESGPRLIVDLPDHVNPTRELAAREVVARVGELCGRGCPVLLVTRIHHSCRYWSQLLTEAGIGNECLLGTQDESEAAAFAGIAAPGRVTVAPHFAARGSVVKVSPETEKLGGLRIVFVQMLPSPRHQRNLVARCTPQGVPGSVQRILSLDDEMIANYSPAWWRQAGLPFLRKAMLRYCQWRVSRDHANARNELLRTEDFLGDLLAFSGHGE